jgi:hypothetical protein
VRVRAFGVEAGDDVEVRAETFERLQDDRQLEVGADFLRHPDVHDRAVRDVDRAEAQRPGGRCLGQRRVRGHHRIEQGQGNRGSDAFQDRAAGQVLLAAEHKLLSALARRI